MRRRLKEDESISKSNEDDFVNHFINTFGEDITKTAIKKCVDLYENGDCAVINGEGKIVFRGSRNRCFDYWFEQEDNSTLKIAEVFYDMHFDLDTRDYNIPNDLTIHRIIIE